MVTLASLLNLLPAVGSIVARMPEFKKVYDELVMGFKETDQVVLREAYEELISDNDEGHARLQEKLKKAQG